MQRAKYGSRQTELMEQINETADAQPSLALLAAWMDAPLSSTHKALAALERRGLVQVSGRGRSGKPLRIVSSRPT